ncbi:hypothetical protein J2Y60_004324 [Arcicella sp. BE140]|nr:hypothetical protein [Arcicella sp. BE51]MDR6814108.1 hypothetical protein [Arcicella sp. BE140]MDR6825420.1 hypothetical protein [Arcicella sp. BE139]
MNKTKIIRESDKLFNILDAKNYKRVARTYSQAIVLLQKS